MQNFQKYKQELAERLFALYNREVFENSLPSDTEIYWSARLVKTAGRCHSKTKPGNFKSSYKNRHFLVLFEIDPNYVSKKIGIMGVTSLV